MGSDRQTDWWRFLSLPFYALSYSSWCLLVQYRYLFEHSPAALNLELCVALWVESCENAYGWMLSDEVMQKHFGKMANGFLNSGSQDARAYLTTASP